MRANDARGLERAKREVDLAALLGDYGWQSTPGRDSQCTRDLTGYDGQQVVISPPNARESHWQWFRASDGRGGNIYDACVELLGLNAGQALRLIRNTLADPPAPLAVASEDGSSALVKAQEISTSASAPAQRSFRLSAPRSDTAGSNSETATDSQVASRLSSRTGEDKDKGKPREGNIRR